MKRSAMTVLALAIAFTAVANEIRAQDQAGVIDKKTSGSSVRASQLIGMTIHNGEGKSLGKINDLVIDAQAGRVRYAAVSYGGFLGLGDKLFAIPWAAFQSQGGIKANDHKLILNLNESQLKGGKGFDKDHWPDFGDPTMTDQLDQYYGVASSSNPNAGVGVAVGPNGVKVDVGRRRE